MRLLASPRRRGFFIALLAALLALSGCSTDDPVSRGRIDGFGGVMDITLIGVDRRRAAEITRILEADVRVMEKAWHASDPGPLSHVNQRFNESDAPFAAPPSIMPLLRLSKRLSEQSDDLFNPANGHLVRAWGFQSASPDCWRPPAEDVVQQILESRPTMRDVTIDGLRIAAAKQTVKLDFRDIQRGFAIDQAIARLQELGVNNASINMSGDIRAIGSRGGHPWSVPIRGPEGGGIMATLQILGNEAAFTAGNYRRNFVWDDEVYHDILDPRTGYPAEHTASVTVLHANATTADAAATALFVAGPKDWHRVARQMGIHFVMLTDREGRLHMNPAMRERVKLLSGDREVIISEPLT